ncbi:STS14 protein [Dichanthelium oligosanthes]|uniref:STS14 protein n=1 Tax=Dichanthelium oligosanthes TaxID=888268 RepID=A0A1E5WM04_9POAL|nr:STS14 protein [Dichanthelium oligosanthes]
MAPSRCHRLLPTTMATTCFLLLLLLALCAAPAPAHGARALTTPRGAGAATKAQQGGTDTSSGNATAAGDEYLAPHNQARAAVGVAPLRWSADLSSAAGKVVAQQQRQGGCAFADMGASPYGANQGWASYRARPGEVVASWVAQGRYYTHANNTCAAGRQCGTYTQVVWRRTAQVGCAQATCATGATLTLCLYDPHGNVQGQSPY